MVNTLWENIFKITARERSISRILSENVLFKDLTTLQRRFVENIVHERQYRKGEFIFQQGEVGVGMYIIVKGGVEILVSDSPIANKEHVVVTNLSAGDFFGELSLVEDNSRRSASAKASEDTSLIGFFKPDLMEILERNPEVGVKVVFRLAEVLGRRLRETTDKITILKKELIHIAPSEREG